MNCGRGATHDWAVALRVRKGNNIADFERKKLEILIQTIRQIPYPSFVSGLTPLEVYPQFRIFDSLINRNNQ